MHQVVGDDGQFGKLCELIGAPALSSDPRFVTNPRRNAHRDAPKQLLEAKLAQFDCEPLADPLLRVGVPSAPIMMCRLRWPIRTRNAGGGGGDR